MFAKFLTTSSLVTAIALTPMVAPAPAQAQDARDILGGLLIGGAIGYGIAATQQPRPQVIVPPRPPQVQPPAVRPPQQPRPPQANYEPPRPAIPATEAGRQVQTALNYFGFNAGYVDGQVGPATRSAVERYQAAQGYPINGRDFPEDQARYLIGASLRASNGGQEQSGSTGSALLAAYQGVLEGRSFAAVPEPAPTTVIVNPGTTTVLPAPGTGQPITTATGPTAGGVPNLFAGAAADPSLSAACDQVALAAQANGGMMHLTNLTNPGTALTEQFCIARAGAVNTGHELTQAIPGLTYTQIAAQCEGFSAAVAGQTGLIGSLHPTQVVAAANGFAITTGIPAAELVATSRVCLGIGYSSDDMQMAMGSALMLVAAGEGAYAELLGHHLRQGVGVAADDHRAHAWYDVALATLESGAPAVFSPNDAGRTPLLRQAVGLTFGGIPTAPVPAAAPAPAQIPVIPGAAAFAPQNVPLPAPQPVAPAPSPVAVNPEPIISVPAPAPIAVAPPQTIIEPIISSEPRTPIAAAPVTPEPNIGALSLPTFEVQQ